MSRVKMAPSSVHGTSSPSDSISSMQPSLIGTAPSSSQSSAPSSPQVTSPSSSASHVSPSIVVSPILSLSQSSSTVSPTIQSTPTRPPAVRNPLVAAGLIPEELSDILATPPADAALNKKKGTKRIRGARALTEEEYRQMLADEEKKKKEAALEKERKRQEREKKAEREREEKDGKKERRSKG